MPMNIVRTLGSFRIAVFLITSLLTLLIVSTTFESIYGIEPAQNIFYTARWFDIFLSLFGINIFFATLSRRPFKLRHTGFIITHTGILMLLAGSLMSRLLGIEGQMTLFEDEKWNHIRTKGYEITLASPGNPDYAFNIPTSESKAQHRLQIPQSDLLVQLNSIQSNLEEQVSVQEGTDFENAAAKLNLKSVTANVDMDVFLIEENPFDPYSNEQQLGPATFRIITNDSAEMESTNEVEIPSLTISNILNFSDFVIPLSPLPSTPYLLTDTDIKIIDLKYYEAAVVKENQLINDTTNNRFNPALEVTFQNREGVIEKHTKFFLFPDFESIHGKTTPDSLNLHVELKVPVPLKYQKEEPAFLLTFKDGLWTYQLKGSKNAAPAQEVSVGQVIPTGWMDMQVTVKALYQHAVVSSDVVQTKDETKQLYGASLTYPINGNQTTQWTLPHRPAVFATPEGPVTASVSISSHKLPFSLVLNDFRKVDYPGTQDAMSFESDVTLIDSFKNTTLTRTIKMNEPLDYAGFRIFQSSYIQDPEHGEASVFTIAKNPGILLQYAGAIILVLGILTLFYIKPLSSVLNRIHGGSK